MESWEIRPEGGHVHQFLFNLYFIKFRFLFFRQAFLWLHEACISAWPEHVHTCVCDECNMYKQTSGLKWPKLKYINTCIQREAEKTFPCAQLHTTGWGNGHDILALLCHIIAILQRDGLAGKILNQQLFCICVIYVKIYRIPPVRPNHVHSLERKYL